MGPLERALKNIRPFQFELGGGGMDTTSGIVAFETTGLFKGRADTGEGMLVTFAWIVTLGCDATCAGEGIPLI